MSYSAWAPNKGWGTGVAGVIVDEEEQYEVEKILDSKVVRKKFKYLVKWKGYPDSENSWEPEENVKDAKQAVAKFHKEHPGAPRPIAASLFLAMNFRSINENFDTPPSESLRHVGQWENGVSARLPGKRPLGGG